MDTRFVMQLAYHARCGADSPLRSLPSDLLDEVHRMSNGWMTTASPHGNVLALSFDSASSGESCRVLLSYGGCRPASPAPFYEIQHHLLPTYRCLSATNAKGTKWGERWTDCYSVLAGDWVPCSAETDGSIDGMAFKTNMTLYIRQVLCVGQKIKVLEADMGPGGQSPPGTKRSMGPGGVHDKTKDLALVMRLTPREEEGRAMRLKRAEALISISRSHNVTSMMSIAEGIYHGVRVALIPLLRLYYPALHAMYASLLREHTSLG